MHQACLEFKKKFCLNYSTFNSLFENNPLRDCSKKSFDTYTGVMCGEPTPILYTI